MTDLLGGKYPGIPEPIAGVRARGWNSYFPIPYAKHCKVTSDGGDFYYHVNYRTYPRNTKVSSLTAADIENSRPETDRLSVFFLNIAGGGRPDRIGQAPKV